MSEIRKYFTSRFDNGHIMEFDFSQLEVVVLAYLTQDKQLIRDIEDGVDMHVVNAAKMFGIHESVVTSAQRKIAKQLSFQLQYGAGYKSMAKSCNVGEDIAKAFIDAYYGRYPMVKLWQDKNIRHVKSMRTLGWSRTKKGMPRGEALCHLTNTGRMYKFNEYDAPDWVREDTSFSPTEIKNYPVQGFATGDIVPMILGKVYRALKARTTTNTCIKMINTVHDSIVFDVAENWEQECYDIVMPIMNSVPHYLKQEFGIDFNVPISADCQIGKNWMDMEKYDGK